MLGGLVAKGITSTATSSSPGMTSIRLLSSATSLSTFCFLILSCSSSSPTLFELLSYAISASAFFELPSTNS
ncbi:hypothetical protein Tco_0473332, partial [Tanacetum coccineum]